MPQDPKDQGKKPPFPQQEQQHPGSEREMSPRPDYGEESYRGVGRLKGRVAVVTGGGGGIGLAAARRMRAEGATIVVGDIDRDAGAAAAEEVSGLFVAVDVTDEDAVNALFDTAAATCGSVDIAFNNAGISPPDDDLIENTELSAWQRVQDVNLKSVYLCCRAALRAARHLHAGRQVQRADTDLDVIKLAFGFEQARTCESH